MEERWLLTHAGPLQPHRGAWRSVRTSLSLRTIIARSRGFHHLPLQSRGFAMHLTPAQGDDLYLTTVSTTAAACPPPMLPPVRLARRGTVLDTRPNTRVMQCDVELASPQAMLPAGVMGCSSLQDNMVPNTPVPSQSSPHEVWGTLGDPACPKPH